MILLQYIMTFYMKPPRGVLHLHMLDRCVRERFNFLQALVNNNEVDVSNPKSYEYLIEGTAMDRAGHFLLRLLSISSQQFQEFFIKAETKFFTKRLNSLNSSPKVRATLKLLHRHADECSKIYPVDDEKYCQFLLSVKHVCEEMMIQSTAAHCFHSNHLKTCTDLYLILPFTMCLPLVQKRIVNMKAGKASVPCGQWKTLLLLFFKMHLQFGIKHLNVSNSYSNAMNDPRINELTNDIGGVFECDKLIGVNGQLNTSNIEHESIHFPPCMAHLWSTLKSKHRLPHEDRRMFSLFLKDVGMTLEESITFWSREYSHPHACGGCTHSWQKDSKRYIYSIRHMYGLEGGRYTYNVPSCRQIQAITLGSAAAGGCPFTHFDDTKLKMCLPKEIKNDEATCKQILHLKAENEPQKACQLYLAACQQIQVEDQTLLLDQGITGTVRFSFINPVQYFLSFKTICSSPLDPI